MDDKSNAQSDIDILHDGNVGLANPAEAFEQKMTTTPVTHTHVIVDGDSDEEVTLVSASAGASSEDPASSGIPSAMTQQHQWSERTDAQSGGRPPEKR